MSFNIDGSIKERKPLPSLSSSSSQNTHLRSIVCGNLATEMNEQAAKTLEGTEMENSKPLKEEEIREKIGKDDERSGGSSYFPVQSTSIGVAEESKESEFKVLPSAQLSESDFKSNFSFSSERLSGTSDSFY